jgi:hypothetical protein
MRASAPQLTMRVTQIALRATNGTMSNTNVATQTTDCALLLTHTTSKALVSSEISTSFSFGPIQIVPHMLDVTLDDADTAVNGACQTIDLTESAALTSNSTDALQLELLGGAQEPL